MIYKVSQKLTLISQEVVQPHHESGRHAETRLERRGSHDEDVDNHATLEQGKHRPLVRIVVVLVTGPGADILAEQVVHVGPEGREARGTRLGGPAGPRVARDAKGAEHGEDPGDAGGDGGGEDEAGHAAEGGLGEGEHGGLAVALAAELDGLEGAHVARDHAEDGDANAALEQHADVGPLQEEHRPVLGLGGAEELVLEAAGDVGDDDEEGSQSSQAL